MKEKDKIRFYLFKKLFPKYFQALQKAMTISREYMVKSPDESKREVGEDIFLRITNRL